MELEKQFRTIVDNTVSKLDFEENNYILQSLEELYKYYNISFTQQFSRDKVLNHICEKRKENLLNFTNSRTEKYSSFVKLKDQLILQNVVNGLPLDPYFSFLENILDMVRDENYIAICDENKYKWAEVIKLTKEYLYITVNKRDFNTSYHSIIRSHDRIISLGESAKYFKDLNYEISITDGRIVLSDSDLCDICSSIEKEIECVGGLQLSASLLNYFKKCYDGELLRFNFKREYNVIGKTEPQIPIGYLINLSLKHLFNKKRSDCKNDRLVSIVEKSIKLCTLYNVQFYNQFETIFLNTRSLPEKIHELVLYDSIYTISQFNPTELPDFLLSMFNFIDDDIFFKNIGWRLKIGIKLISTIFLDWSNETKPLLITRKGLYLRFPEYQQKFINRILDDFSHDKKEVNANFLQPDNYEECNFQFKPLIKINSSKYILLNPSICALGVFETIAELVKRNVDKNVHDKIGLCAENYLREKFKQKNITVTYGYYKKRHEGECDIIIETPERILLFEVKKKSLTRRSRSGYDANIFIDLSNSLLKSITQLNQHEIILNKQGKLELENDTIYHKNRAIEKISVTLFDYGSLSDRFTSQQIINCFAQADYSPNDETYNKEFSDLNKLSEKLRFQLKDIETFNPGSTNIYHNIWFLSIPQLLMILKDSDSTENFCENLFLTKHIRFSTFDFYYEYSYMKKLKNKKLVN